MSQTLSLSGAIRAIIASPLRSFGSHRTPIAAPAIKLSSVARAALLMRRPLRSVSASSRNATT